MNKQTEPSKVPKTMKKQILLTIGLAALLATSTQAQQEQLATSIKEAHVETTRTSDQLKATLASLNALTKQKKGDLRPAYDTYCADVVKTGEAATWTRTRVSWMEGDGQKYFQTWQGTVNSIANESLRKKSQKRLDSVQKSYAKVLESLKLAGEKFKPFLSDLGDIQKALATDVTAGGVKAIKSTVSSANWNHQFVDKAVKSALKEMDKMEKALSPEAK
jgi:septal ring factor EnvC (AmiA/AmiB activator)